MMEPDQRPPVSANNWKTLDVAGVAEFVPTDGVSVVISYFEAPQALRLTLAALSRQTYPKDLVEVVVVDDGSSPPLRADAVPEGVRVVHQEDRGFGLARARNTGVAAANHDIILFLDCDMIPEDDWVRAHARWHHVVGDALTLGFRSHVDQAAVDTADIAGREGSLQALFANHRTEQPEWIEYHMARTNDLTSTDDDIFRIVTGGNLGVRRGFFGELGGFDESFTQWGAEDTEFGFRAYTAGGLLVPERGAFCWHQGLGTLPDPSEAASQTLQHAKIAHLIAHSDFRRSLPGRTFTVPRYTVIVEADGHALDEIRATVEAVLASRIHDIEVVVARQPDAVAETMGRLFGADPRVTIRPEFVLQESRASIHIHIPAGTQLREYTLEDLTNELGTAGIGVCSLEDGTEVRIVRSWVSRRALRNGVSVGDIATLVEVNWRDVGIRVALSQRGGGALAILRDPEAIGGKLIRRVRRVRSPGDAASVVAWMFGRGTGRRPLRPGGPAINETALNSVSLGSLPLTPPPDLPPTSSLLRSLAASVNPACATVAGNQWTEIIAPDQLEPHLSVTVIIPHYEAPEALAITLAALDRQTYPGHLLDVIVVDDGSVSPPAADPALGMRVQVASQPRRGFGASRARHRGAGMATGDVLVFLDADVVPSEACVAAHARWHHQVADALTIGFRDHVDADAVSLSDVVRHDGPLEELFADHDPEPPAWIEAHMTRTHDLTDDVTDLFRVVTSGNLGMRRDLYHALGGFDGTFSEWGLEDTELGYRAAAVGAVLIPERAAHGWHLGRIIKPRQDRIEGMNRQREAISQLIPDPGFRGPIRPGRSYTVPNVVVSVGTARAAADLVLRSVESILASRYHDLVVWVEDSPEDPTFEWLRRQFTPDPRVAFGHLEDAALAYPASRIHISLPSPAEVGEFSIGDMIGEIDAQAMVEFADNGHVVGRVAPSWATHRSLRTGQRPAELGTTRSVSARIVSSKPLAVTAFARRFTRDPGSSVGRIIKQIRAVRSPRQAWRFGVWALGASRRRLQGVRTPELASKAAVPAEYDLGLTISTVGTEARDVFGASSRVASFDPDRSVDVVLSDTPHVAEAGETPVVAIRDGASPLAVRAFDPESVNPIRWIREHDGVVACLGSPDMLSLSLSAGVVQIGPDAVEAFRSAHHVVDIAEFHESVRQRASTLVALAARGVVISLVDDDANLGEYLGVPLTHALRDPRIAASSHHVRERISIAQRREALRTHSLRSRARQLGAAGAVDAPRLAEVSILLATNRPDYLESALDMVGRQTYPRLELALALHGAGFAGDVEARAKELDLRVRVVRVGQEVAFGDALNLAVSASGGTLLTKFDDDDHYGAEHVWDLVLAHEYSRATLVAKAAEFVYLAGTDATIHRFAGRGETYSETLAGGTMLISRDDLKAVDGWRPVSKGVDKALINAVRKNDGVIYRTHGSGYVLVRHGVGHTWASDDSYFLDQATDQRVGLDLEFAGIE